MKNLYLLIAVILSWLGGSAQVNPPIECGVINHDFEAGVTSNYEFKIKPDNSLFFVSGCNVDTSGYNAIGISSNDNQFSNNGATLVDNDDSLVPFGPYDPTLYSLGVFVYRVSPATGGVKAMKLNRSAPGATISTMLVKFENVPNDIVFDYSIVTENPHPANSAVQPFFTARLYTIASNAPDDLIPGGWCKKADATDALFKETLTGGVLYTDWQCATFEVPSEYVGDDLFIEFVMADCGEGGHFGTVYLDNIRCGETCNVFGEIVLDEVHKSCPDDPITVCGSFENPTGGSINTSSITLSILDEDGNILPVSTTPTVTGSTFCFTVPPSSFGLNPSGDYEFVVSADFVISSGTVELWGSSSAIGPDVTFDPINTNIDSFLVSVGGGNSILYWDDVDDSYTLEFRADANCCPGNPNSVGNPAGYYTITTTDNFISLIDVVPNLGETRCFRWRILTNCGWSGWCCLAPSSFGGEPTSDGFANILAPDCYGGESPVCDAITILNTVANEVDPGETAMVDWKTSITAHNLVENDGEAYYKAENYILLLPSFYSEYGSLFATTLEECTVPDMPSSNPAPRMDMYSSEDTESKTEIAANNFTVYPNPTNGLITVTGEAAAVYTVTDITGKQLMSVSNEGQSTSIDIDLTGLNAGIYFLSADGKTIQKIIKN